MTHRPQQQRISVRGGLGDESGADRATGAGLVVDDNRLAEFFTHMLGYQTPHHVHRTARGKRHHQRDRSGRIGLRANAQGERRDGHEQGDAL
ncbi:hypothetical protein CBM2626_B150002 [Cupriavidus taiwanensis]|nr:hypothetical protein CBM2626_B150002 [Cupriavidus taiwanensis]